MIPPSSGFAGQNNNFGLPGSPIMKYQLVHYLHWHWWIFPTCTKVLWALWLVKLGDCLRPLLGKSYQNKKKNSTEETGQWVSGKICAERNTSASFHSWYCLANIVIKLKCVFSSLWLVLKLYCIFIVFICFM